MLNMVSVVFSKQFQKVKTYHCFKTALVIVVVPITNQSSSLPVYLLILYYRSCLQTLIHCEVLPIPVFVQVPSLVISDRLYLPTATLKQVPCFVYWTCLWIELESNVCVLSYYITTEGYLDCGFTLFAESLVKPFANGSSLTLMNLHCYTDIVEDYTRALLNSGLWLVVKC